MLKSSDFIAHDTDPRTAYGSTNEAGSGNGYNNGDDENDDGNGTVEEDALRGGIKIELVLKAYKQINPAREVRCFVRKNILIGELLFHLFDHAAPASRMETALMTMSKTLPKCPTEIRRDDAGHELLRALSIFRDSAEDMRDDQIVLGRRNPGGLCRG